MTSPGPSQPPADVGDTTRAGEWGASLAAGNAAGVEERAEERVAHTIAISAIAAGATLTAGLLASAWAPSIGAALLRWGCLGLLAVPLMRNAAILAIDHRRGIRTLALVLTLLLATIYTFVLVREIP